MSLLRTIINFNKRLSMAVERRLPQSKVDLFTEYDKAAADRAGRLPEGSIVVDIGGGRTCSFAPFLGGARSRVRLVALDISEEELHHNHDVDETRVADASKELPFEDGQVGLLVSRTVLEHVADVGAFVEHASRVIAPGGYAVHMVPCRNAPFAVIARIVPFKFATAALHMMRPESVGVVEFPVFYDKCTYDQMRDAHLSAGFSSVDVVVSYYQSNYFDAVFPVYLLSAAYELMIRMFRRRNLAAYALVIARK